MSKDKGVRYSDDFKRMIVELHKSGKTITELSNEYGLSAPTIRNWTKHYKPFQLENEEIMTSNDVLQLRKEMARMKEENEILKKAMAIFAKESNQ